MTRIIHANLKLHNFKAFAAALEPANFKRMLEKHVGKGTLKAALVAERELRKHVRAKVPPKNAALTIFIKKSRKPLIDHGDLFQAMTSHQVSWDRAFVGVLQTSSQYNIAKTLLEGRSVRVTELMRNMFFLLWRASVGSLDPARLTGRAADLWARQPRGWKPLRDSTTIIVIPPRPFLDVFKKREVIEKIRMQWEISLDKLFAEMAAKKD